MQPGGWEIGDAHIAGGDEQFDLGATGNDPLGSPGNQTVDDLEVAQPRFLPNHSPH